MFKEEAPITTSLRDAQLEISFLDDFFPRFLTNMNSQVAGLIGKYIRDIRDLRLGLEPVDWKAKMGRAKAGVHPQSVEEKAGKKERDEQAPQASEE